MNLTPEQKKKKVRGFRHNMEKYLEGAVKKYCAIADLQQPKLRKVNTPFVDESQETQGCIDGIGPLSEAEIVKAEASLKAASAVSQPAGALAGGGALQKSAASILMTVMFAARLGRFDLLRPVCHLAQSLHAWTPECDRRLHRLMCYINCSLKDRSVGFVGDEPKDLWLGLFADADFAGDRKDSKSTAGVLLVLMGPNTFYPLTALSQKHGCTSHSTTEAEVVSLNTALRTIGLPSLDLWEVILGGPVTLVAYEDNQATGKVVRSGKYKALRHVGRCHGVQLSFLTETLIKGLYRLDDCHTKAMAADIFTKAFTCPKRWAHAIELIGILRPDQLTRLRSIKEERLAAGELATKRSSTPVLPALLRFGCSNQDDSNINYSMSRGNNRECVKTLSVPQQFANQTTWPAVSGRQRTIPALVSVPRVMAPKPNSKGYGKGAAARGRAAGPVASHPLRRSNPPPPMKAPPPLHTTGPKPAPPPLHDYPVNAWSITSDDEAENGAIEF